MAESGARSGPVKSGRVIYGDSRAAASAFRLLKTDEFIEIPADGDGLLASATFHGLVIDSAALTSGDLSTALARLS